MRVLWRRGVKCWVCFLVRSLVTTVDRIFVAFVLFFNFFRNYFEDSVVELFLFLRRFSVEFSCWGALFLGVRGGGRRGCEDRF